MIPKAFHFIWISNDLQEDNDVKDNHLKVIRSFGRYNSDYELVLWKNKGVRAILEKYKKIMPKAVELIYDDKTLLAQKTDIIRMIILKEHGGIYVDLDTICVGNFDDLLEHSFFIGEEKAKCKEHMHDEFPIASDMHYIQNCCVGSEKNHILIAIYFRRLLSAKNKYRISYGPNLCEDALYHYKELYGDLSKDGIKILNNDYFFSCNYFETPHVNNLKKFTKIIHFYSGTSKNGK